MKKKIFIVHQAEIVRKGLTSMLQDRFGIEVIRLQDEEAFAAYSHISNNKIVLFYGMDIFSGEGMVDLLCKKNDLVKVLIAGEPIQSIAQDHCITINTGADEICELVQKSLNLRNKSNRQPEGKELTRRETEVLKLVASGFSNKKIANDLFISTHTVISHRKKITEKTGIKSISGLTVYAILNGLIDAGSMNPEDLI